MKTPRYVARVARLPAVFEQLAQHPEGLSLDALADAVGVPSVELFEDLMAFYSADVGPEWLMGLSRPWVLEFLGPDGDDDIDPNDAHVVRIVDPRPFDELGVEYVDASELALIYTAARALQDLSPGDADLDSAIDVLAETMFGDSAQSNVPGGRPWDHALAPLQRAQRERRRVRIEYSRAWESGVLSRTIEPWRLVQTRRGWEVDAGPADDRGLRTYLLSNIRDAELLDETFVLPEDAEGLLERQRITERARVRVPHASRWAADVYAETVTVVEDDEHTVTLDLDLLPPLGRRIGLLLLAAGPGADLVTPVELVDAGAALAADLLDHHRP